MLRRLSAVAVACLLPGCGPSGPDIGTGDLLQVTLPDLSRMHAYVQEQYREAHAAVTTLEADPRAEARERGDAYGRLGMLLMAGEHFDAAEPCLLNARRLAPDEFRWIYYLAHLFEKKGDLTAAVEHFEQAIAMRPADFPTLIHLANAYIDAGRPAAVGPVMERARTLRPGDAGIRYQLGRAALASRDYAGAVESLEAALRLNPRATIAHYPLALAYRGLGDLDNARRHLERSGTRSSSGFEAGLSFDLEDPLQVELREVLRSPQLHRDLALRADANRNWPEAAIQFRRAVEMEPDNPTLRLSLGIALNRAGDSRTALAELEEAARLDPALAQAHDAIGAILERAGRDGEAVDHYLAAVEYDPESPATRRRLADAMLRTGRPESALSHYLRVIEIDPDAEEARFGEAMALVRLNRHREARQRLLDAMSHHPGQPAFANALARLLAASPDPRVRDGRRAFELVQGVVQGQRTTAVAETMAMALAELGQFGVAIEWQRMAMEVARDAGRSDIAREMSANLDLYTRGQPSRTPWRDDEPELRPGPAVEPGLLGP